MRAGKTLIAALILVASAFADIDTAAQAAGALEPTAGTQGLGIHIIPRWDTTMYSAPGHFTPRTGTAWQGDLVTAICWKQDNSQYAFVLGIERPGRNGVQWANTAGYLWSADFWEDISGLPSCLERQAWVRPSRDTGMYSAPGLSTPRIGTAWADELVNGICKIPDNGGNRLVLGIHVEGRNGAQWAQTAGYLWAGDLREDTDVLPDCGLR